jgi:hypothetical protein
VFDHQVLARIALTALCAIQGIATLAIDSTRSHARNPEWVGHARFHVVWQSVLVTLLSAVELTLIWTTRPYRQEAFYFAILLAALSPLSFLAALVAKGSYGGTLSDPNGIQPVQMTIRGTLYRLDGNLIAVVVALIVLGGIIWIYK